MTAKMAATTLNLSTSYINRNYRIKVSGIDNEGNRVHKLVGVKGMIDLIGVDFANKFLDRAENCLEDSCCCKLRRGIKVTFYNK